MYQYPYVYRLPFPSSVSHWPHHAGWYTPHQYQLNPYQPLQQWPTQHTAHAGATTYSTPYPKPNPVLAPPPSGIQSIMAQFKSSDGTYDINKMMNTMGQMINTVNQVGGVLKGLVGAFKK
ncbi:YppG family protein [Anoxybacteroides tepidamans]|uniref:YppG family protein n=1 Tax=Anoxybacteroides tepidamans TaxID=265948 RepID=UPI0004866A5C|nr:YppG family protein [Anoxybacillus tepidamans]